MQRSWQRELQELAENPYWRAGEARRALRAVERSKLDDVEVAERYGLSLSRLQRWRKRLDGTTGAPVKRTAAGNGETRFLAVRVRSSASSVARGEAATAGEAREGSVEVLVGERRVRAEPGFDVATLQQVVQALEALPC